MYKFENLRDQISIYADGAILTELSNEKELDVDGYTFNPSIFRNHGAENYISYCKEILEIINKKPVSLEVIADEEKEMIKQAKILNKLSNNVYVKIPIMFTDGKSTINVINELASEKIKLNITAIFLIEQIKEILSCVKDSKSILSIFAGRLFDSGFDAVEEMKKINEFIKKESNCMSLWASTRMSFDLVNAIRAKTDIITMQTSQLKKLKLFGKDRLQYSRETVSQFYKDAKESNYKI